MSGRHFCVSFVSPYDVKICHEIGQSIVLDNGAYTIWKQGGSISWDKYYDWTDEWLDCPTTWAIIPDVIDGGGGAQDKLISEWPHGNRGAPVWHLDESLDRLCGLIDDGWPKICLGSAGAYAQVASDPWVLRMFKVFNRVDKLYGRLPWLHGLRMQGVGHLFPFGSVDSADIARNHHLPHQSPRKMADNWDGSQPRFIWWKRPEQSPLGLNEPGRKFKGGKNA